MVTKIPYGTSDREDETSLPDAAPAEESQRARDDETKKTAAIGAATGAVVGAVVAGPLGAVAGGAVGAAVGAANGADVDEPGSTGNVTDDDERRTKRTYDGQIYEEGSLDDVRRDDQI
jgi:uncharacterized protein YcfJ